MALAASKTVFVTCALPYWRGEEGVAGNWEHVVKLMFERGWGAAHKRLIQNIQGYLDRLLLIG